MSTGRIMLLATAMFGLGLGLGYFLSLNACRRNTAPKPQESPSQESPRPTRPSKGHPRSSPNSELPAPTLQPDLPAFSLVLDDFGYAPPELVTRLCAQPIVFSGAVLPYLEHSRESARILHQSGKQVLLHLPLEPLNFPKINPGPQAILASHSEADTRMMVRKAFLEVPYVQGVNNHMGSRITPDRMRMGWILSEIKTRKFFFVDSRTEKDSVALEVARELGIPTVQRNVFLDDDRNPAEIERQWDRALDWARREGQVLAIGHPHPETIELLERLIPKARKQVRFVKAQALAD